MTDDRPTPHELADRINATRRQQKETVVEDYEATALAERRRWIRTLGIGVVVLITAAGCPAKKD